MNKRLAALFVLLFLLALLPVSLTAKAETKLEIATAQEWEALAKACESDAYSKGLKVLLTADLDLSGTENAMIPLWQGVFDGQDHRISGLTIDEAGAVMGLFRRILPGGSVKNLNLEASMISGSAETLGGLAGQNEGRIENCRFSGRVEGKRLAGGLAGLNGPEGVISGCSAAGYVGGQHRIGGIAGENAGLIENSVNEAEVNTVYQVSSQTEYVVSVLNGEEILDITDIGGIAGLSSGSISGCENRGGVGYTRTAYNVGGIAGRMSGHVADCRNEGKVKGRKDTGGIVGQMEPEGSWSYSTARLELLNQQLEDLHQAIDTAALHGIESQSSLMTDLEALRDSFGLIRGEVAVISQETEDWVNGNLGAVNQISSRLQAFMKGMAPVTDKLSAFSSGIGNTLSIFEDMTEILKCMISEAGSGSDDFKASLASLREVFATARSSLEQADAAFKALGDVDQNLKDEKKALSDLSASFSGLASSFGGLGGDLAGFKMGPLPDPDKEEDPAEAYRRLIYDTLQDFLGIFQSNTPAFNNSFAQIGSAFTTLASTLDVTAAQLDAGLIGQAVQHIGEAVSGIKPALSSLEDTASHMENALSHLKGAGEKLSEAADSSKGLSEALRGALWNLSGAFSSLSGYFSAAGQEEALEFKTISEAQSQAMKRFFEELDALNTRVGSLNADLADVALLQDIKDIAAAAFSLSLTLLDTVYGVTSGGEGLPRARDISALEDESRTKGAVDRCLNYGSVQAETNVGGVVGSIALEISTDPEDELSLKSLAVGAEYLIFAVIRRCENYGDISAVRSAAGGIAGRMDYGAVLSGLSAGSIEAAEGYAGGIAGRCEGLIASSTARNNLKGASYLGGIAGLGQDIKDCLALPYFESQGAFQGAIAGQAEGEVRKNYYAESPVGGVNGFSFAGEAERIEFEELVAKSAGSQLLKDVEVRFEVEGVLLETRSVPFGTGLESLPEVADKDGRIWRWEEFDRTHIYFSRTVRGSYVRPLSTLSDGLDPPLVLVEGVFSEEDRLEVRWLSEEELKEKAAPLLTEGRGLLGFYQLQVPGYQESLKIHLRAEGGLLYDVSGSVPVEIPWTREASYLVFEGVSGGFYVLIKEERPLIWPYAAAGGVLLGACLAAWLIRRRKKNKAAEAVHED